MSDKVVQTAMVMLQVLSASEKVRQRDLREAVTQQGGDVRYIGHAAKWLRDRGVSVATHKRRQLSLWWIHGERLDFDEYVLRVQGESYSEAVSLSRAFANMPGAGPLRDKATVYAVVIGERMGLSPAAVMDACQPLEMP